MAGHRHDVGEAGFSLTELLVVVFIIGLMSTLVLVSIPPAATPLERAADRLENSLSQAAREAIVSGEPIAWSHSATGGSRFEAYRQGEWTGLGNVRTAGPTSNIEIRVEHLGLTLAEDETDEEGGARRGGRVDSFVRSVIFYPVGEATPARIHLSEGLEEIVLRVDATGDVMRNGDAL